MTIDRGVRSIYIKGTLQFYACLCAYLKFNKNQFSCCNYCSKQDYFNISNPGPVKQEPGQELILIILLYESFYDGQDGWDPRRPCRI